MHIVNEPHHIAIFCSDAMCAIDFYEALGFTLYRRCEGTKRHVEIVFISKHEIVEELFID